MLNYHSDLDFINPATVLRPWASHQGRLDQACGGPGSGARADCRAPRAALDYGPFLEIPKILGPG